MVLIMKKVFLSVLLILLFAAACAVSEKPIEEHWAYKDIIELAEKKLIAVIDDVRPNADVTRAEFLNLLLSVAASPDVPEIKDGLFVSKKPITRGDAVYIIVVALKLQDKGGERVFSDVADNSYIYSAYDAGFIRGYPGGRFNPNETLTRAECMAIIYRISDSLKGGADINFETERKFLLDVTNIPYDQEDARKYDIIQTYINYSPEVRVRKLNGTQYWFALKMPKDSIGLSRLELEFPIIAEEYERLYAEKAEATLEKTRYQYEKGAYSVAVDIYSGDLSGLAVSEIEFDSVEEANAFVPFDWYIKDVTSDARYKNANLAKNGLPKD